MFYFCVFLNLAIFSLITYSILKFKNKVYRIGLPLQLLKFILPLMSTTFFLPIFFVFMSAFDCTERNTSLYTDELKCYTTFFYINCAIASISIILFVPICSLVVIIFYEYSLDGEKKVLSKTTSKPDVFFLWLKILVTTIFVSINGGVEVHYILIITLMFFSSISVFLNFAYERYNQNILNFMHKFLSLTFLWGSICLMIGKMAMNDKFNSCLGLFFIMEPIFFLILFYKKKNLKTFLSKIGREETLPEFLLHIQSFLYIIEKKKEERKSELILDSYIYLYERNCILEDCPLKRYLKLNDTNSESYGCLLQHANLLFNISLSKYPESNEIKFAYALFLLKKLKKRKKASEFLKGIQNLSPSIEEDFIIFRCNKIFEDNLSDLEDEEDESVDVVKELRYRNYFKNFIDLIIEASTLYIDFWNQLLDTYNNGNESVYKLNHCGTKINHVVEEIDYIFEEMKQLKANNFYCMKIYYEFVSKILCDRKKSLQFKNLLNEMVQEYKRKIPPEFKDFNMNIINTNDYYQYIIVSSQQDNFGIITNASLSISGIFGYETKDLIGQSIDIIIPEIYQEEHNKILKRKIRNFKKKNFDEEYMKNIEIKELIAFAKSKSKYLVELNMKIILYQSEFNEQFFIASLNKESSFFHTNNEQKRKNICYILTDLYLIIQNYTPNTSSLLDISSDMMNNNIEITYYIKQLYQDFLRYAVNMGELTPQQKLNLKKKIILKNYSIPTLINWKRTEFNESRLITTRVVDLLKKTRKETNKLKFKENGIIEQLFYLTVKEEIINNKAVGYLFKLEIPEEELKRVPSSTIRLPFVNKRSLRKINSLATRTSEAMSLENFNIPYDYIPQSNLNLQLDINSFTYKLNNTETNEEIKEYAKRKILKLNEKKKIENEDEEEEEEEEENSSDIVDSNFMHNNKKFNDKSSSDSDNFIKYSNKKTDDFYQVNCNKIKLFIYNFHTLKFDEIVDYNKMSQIERKMSDFPKKKIEDMKSRHEYKVEEPKETNLFVNFENIEIPKIDKNDFIIKQIENCLQKEENQESIIKLAFRSIISFILIISITILFMVYILKGIKTIKSCSKIILNSGMMMELNSISIFYIRELTLLNNENYTSFPSRLNKEEYIDLIKNTLIAIFIKFDGFVQEDTSTNLDYSNKTKYEISERVYKLSNIRNDLSIVYTTNNLNSALIEISMDIFNIYCKLIDEIISTDHDVYHFLSNCLNNIGEAFNTQLQVYIDEIEKQIQKLKIICYIGGVFIFVIVILIYFLISQSYYLVSEKKENYIEIFFEIDFEVIKICIERCENYMKRVKGEIEEYDDIDDKEQDTNTQTKNHIHHLDKNSKRKMRAKELSRQFLIKIIIFLSLLAIYYAALLYFYITFLNASYINVKYSQQQCISENEYHLIFNSLREASFDNNSNVHEMNVNVFLQNELEKIYVIRRKANVYMNEHRKKMTGNFYNKYTELLLKQPCNFRLNDYFISDNECITFMNNSTTFGLEVTTSYFVEEIRYANQYRRFITYNNQYYNNLTLVGTHFYYQNISNITDEFYTNSAINFFNGELMTNLSIFYRNFIIPFYNELRTINVESVDDYFVEIRLLFVCLLSSYLFLIMFLFFFFWIPYIRELNRVIYKTKNLLSIIPKEVLMNIKEIYSLLGIEDKYIKEENKNKKS